MLLESPVSHNFVTLVDFWGENRWLLGGLPGGPRQSSQPHLSMGCSATLPRIWLVVWLPSMNYFPRNIGNVIIPTDFHIFQRGWNHQPGIMWIRTGHSEINQADFHEMGGKFWLAQLISIDGDPKSLLTLEILCSPGREEQLEKDSRYGVDIFHRCHGPQCHESV